MISIQHFTVRMKAGREAASDRETSGRYLLYLDILGFSNLIATNRSLVSSAPLRAPAGAAT